MTTDIEKRTQTQLKQLFDQKRGTIVSTLPPNTNIDRLVSELIMAVNNDEKLAQCSVASLFYASVVGMQMGLNPFGAQKHAYLIPYMNKKKNVLEAQFMPSWMGLVHLANRSPNVKNIYPEVIHENDEYLISRGTNPEIQHTPNYVNRGKAILYYAVIQYTHSTDFEVMTLEDIEKIRKASKAPNSPAWQNWFGEMAKKAVIKRLLKRVSLNAEGIANAIQLDHDIATGKSQDFIVIDAENLAVDSQHFKDNMSAQDHARNM